jgi:S1-C subfamily serine protease
VNGDGFPALRLGDSDQIRVGQTAIAIGNPLGEFANSVSRGIISGLKRRVVAGAGNGRGEEVLSDIIQTDAAINPGNSGGPLLNLAGEVIGINVAVAQGAENIGFAIPVNQIKRAVDEVKRTGKIAVPYLGVRYILIDAEVAKAMGLSIDQGALIQRGQNITDLAVVPGSPADKAGLVENDIILEIDGQKIDAEHPLANLIGSRQVGDTVKLKILHRGEEQTLSVRLEERK